MNTEENNKVVEVFGTKEVSVKEFMRGSSDKSLVLLSDYELAKKNLLELKEKHENRVSELVLLEQLDVSELKELNSIRAELREPRYLVQNIEKNNISVFESYKKTDKANLKELIDINRELEDKASEKIKSEDLRKQQEKDSEAKAEENRIAKIKSDIENIEIYCLEVVQKMTFENMKTSCESIEQSLNSENDFEEYYLLFDQVKDRIAKLVLEKTNDITSRENQRLENEQMKKEIFEVRVNRLKEAGLSIYDDCLKDEKETKEVILSIENIVLNASASEFETMLSDIKLEKEKDEQSKLDSEIKKQKEEQFEVRKNRLFEIGFLFNESHEKFYYNDDSLSIGKLKSTVYDASITEFEEILSTAKQSIIDAEKQKEANELAEQEKRKQEAIAKKKAETENKARVKRLVSDKEMISNCIALIGFSIPLHVIENQETIDFIKVVESKINELKADLLTQLKEL